MNTTIRFAAALFAVVLFSYTRQTHADFFDDYVDSGEDSYYPSRDRDYDRYENDRERRRIERERDELERERNRLDREKDAFDSQKEEQEHCPPGFSPSENKCSQEERRRGCKDIRLDSGLGCVRR